MHLVPAAEFTCLPGAWLFGLMRGARFYVFPFWRGGRRWRVGGEGGERSLQLESFSASSAVIQSLSRGW